MSTPTTWVVARLVAQRPPTVVGPASGADDGVTPCCQAVGTLAVDAWARKNSTTASAPTEVAQLVADVEASRQLEVVGVVDGARTPVAPIRPPAPMTATFVALMQAL